MNVNLPFFFIFLIDNHILILYITCKQIEQLNRAHNAIEAY